MSTTAKMSYDELLRRALSKSKKSTKTAKFDKKKNYAGFWMDDLGKGNDRFGLGGDFSGKGGDLVRSIKLNSYRNAIANFVKILTNKEIPVRFEGSDSYTDGKSITISTDIKDNNFDVTVGLALHEASHVLLTDFSVLPKIHNGEHTAVEQVIANFPLGSEAGRDYVKQILNWVEDRRIDNYVFSTSPGYKAYYHKLYDHYFNNDEIVTKGLRSKKFGNPTNMESWMMHIINMTNPAFNPNAMKGLKEVAQIVDLPNIGRLKSTQDALDVALAMIEVIAKYLKAPKQDQTGDSQPQPKNSGSMGGSSEQQEGSSEEQEEGDDLSDQEAQEIEDHLHKQREFTDGKLHKKTASRSLASKLQKAQDQQITLESVGDKYTCLNYDNTGKDSVAAVDAIDKASNLTTPSYSDSDGWIKYRAEKKRLEDIAKVVDRNYYRNQRLKQVEAVNEGMQLGQLLGKKLQLRNESRERIDNRLRSGKIDNRRLAAAGYGIESIFHQVTVDKYKKANIHLSIDASGSMGGTKWHNTIKLAMAIAKAITYTQNVSMQISMRATTDRSAANFFVYDSRKNTLRELQLVLGSFDCNGMTPEGLCFESMLKKNQLIKSDSSIDSYFVNISDGDPGGVGNYHGTFARRHTRTQVNRMRNELGIKVLSYFMSSWTATEPSDSFTEMYGKSAQVVSADNALQIAKTLNTMFMSK